MENYSKYSTLKRNLALRKAQSLSTLSLADAFIQRGILPLAAVFQCSSGRWEQRKHSTASALRGCVENPFQLISYSELFSPGGPTKPQSFLFQNSVFIWWMDLVKRGIHSPLKMENNFYCLCLRDSLFMGWGGHHSFNWLIVKICSLTLHFSLLKILFLKFFFIFFSSSMETTKN